MITIINGGTQGVGEAVARKLVGDGSSTGLVLVERGKALADELTGLGTPAVFIPADIGDLDSPGMVVETCASEFGTVHGVARLFDVQRDRNRPGRPRGGGAAFASQRGDPAALARILAVKQDCLSMNRKNFASRLTLWSILPTPISGRT